MGLLQERLDYELSVIQKMGYVDYFLIVWDFINYAKNAWHPGRTGAWFRGGKSLSPTCLEITRY